MAGFALNMDICSHNFSDISCVFFNAIVHFFQSWAPKWTCFLLQVCFTHLCPLKKKKVRCLETSLEFKWLLTMTVYLSFGNAMESSKTVTTQTAFSSWQKQASPLVLTRDTERLKTICFLRNTRTCSSSRAPPCLPLIQCAMPMGIKMLRPARKPPPMAPRKQLTPQQLHTDTEDDPHLQGFKGKAVF